MKHFIVVLAVVLVGCADNNLGKPGTTSALPTDTGTVGPQGPAGPAGPQGPQGIQGPRGVAGGIALHSQDGTYVGFVLTLNSGGGQAPWVYVAEDECVVSMDPAGSNKFTATNGEIYFSGASCTGSPVIGINSGFFPLACITPRNGKTYKVDQPVAVVANAPYKSILHAILTPSGGYTQQCVELPGNVTGASASELPNPKFPLLSGPYYWDAR